jgi:hypothetical protein
MEAGHSTPVSASRAVCPNLEKTMSPRTILTAAAFAASTLCQVAMAQSASAPVSRAAVKADTRAAEKAGKLTPDGEGPQFTVPRTSTKTRAERKADTLAARKAGTLEPAGEADIAASDRKIAAQPTTVNRAARKAETRAEEKAGQLVPAGEGPGAPKK